MADKSILITGGAGFIGSNYIHYILKRTKKIHVLNLDNLTYAGNLLNLKTAEKDSRYDFVKGDISNRAKMEKLFSEYNFHTVVNFAAESHVDRSILNPDKFIKTNVLGTEVLLDCAKKYNVKKFIQISTDEVYGSVLKGRSKENSNLAPNSPYSATKASADLLCRSFYKTYGVPVIITRSSNNYGPLQFPEKLIPLMINNVLDEKPLPIYSDGRNMRDWIYVQDNCEAIYKVMMRGKAGEIYNIGTGKTDKNINIVNNICKILSEKTGKPLKSITGLISYVKDRPAHDFRYCLDNSKISNELGWKPTTDLSTGLEKTIDWYLKNQNWVKSVLNKDYMKYYKLNYSNR
ncbi:MAG: dTDP-glucose 4,6-dehydratase [Candidatus Dadabacteria bacterium]|nr:dTDP-glucose 4,6-dehydratase [Candidatus Dadabacteria bacterium]NIS07994.1 dTDP-glucose 4,6-dehydratase [Candidatus Dadabacteria bacterium]NIV41911.1 dTDP-glucose 4,6-dehydratase [Candidatus Dadabacteria bacterium]NIX16363.1 dTDP-glucose 4,6-dehydratase [Candidatus Dadabacteria bacterium]NIY22962.1 dTDP-glucose 4,6-dehydratase [Candidatus Dadabacteria bacterium]